MTRLAIIFGILTIGATGTLNAQQERAIQIGDTVKVWYGLGGSMVGRLASFGPDSITILHEDETRRFERSSRTLLMGRRKGAATLGWTMGGTVVGAILGAASKPPTRTSGSCGGRDPYLGYCNNYRRGSTQRELASPAAIVGGAVLGAVGGYFLGRTRDGWARAPLPDELESRLSLTPSFVGGLGLTASIRLGG